MSEQIFTAEETELYAFCTKFLNTCNSDTVEKYGEGKLNNIPFRYCTYFQICAYLTLGDASLEFAQCRNHVILQELFAKAMAIRKDMQADIEQAERT